MFFTTIEEWIGLAIALPICILSGIIQARIWRSQLYEAHNKPFTITKGQYDKDIEQAKVAGVSEYIRKREADISSVNGCKVSWRDEEACKDNSEQGLTKEQSSDITKQILRLLENPHD